MARAEIPAPVFHMPHLGCRQRKYLISFAFLDWPLNLNSVCLSLFDMKSINLSLSWKARTALFLSLDSSTHWPSNAITCHMTDGICKSFEAA
jgi:hypothetical protein